MPSLVMIGTEGVGKTVLLTILAKYLEVPERMGCFLDPQSRKTIDYVEETYQTLKSGEWPAHTEQGSYHQLHWKLRGEDLETSDVCFIDPPGHDILRLFAYDENQEEGELIEVLQHLKQQVFESEIVLFLLNLGDFRGSRSHSEMVAREWAIKHALDLLRLDPNRKVCLVFTQCDQYRQELKQQGSWLKVAQKYLPKIYGAHLMQGGVPVLAVAAISNPVTEVRENGIPGRYPPGKVWKHKGIEGLVKWITEAIRTQKDYKVLSYDQQVASMAGSTGVPPADTASLSDDTEQKESLFCIVRQ